MPKHVERFEIEYWQDINEKVPAEGHWKGFRNRYLGKRRLRCEVEVIIDTDALAASMGSIACRATSGRCTAKSGKITVKRIGQPKELSREMKENPE